MPLKFAYLCELFHQLETLDTQARDVPVLIADRRARYSETIEKWFRDNRKIIDAPGTDRVALLSSLFPERRTDRVYWLQPKGLLNVLCRCLGYGNARLQRLRSWKPSNETDLVSWVVAIVKATDAGMPPSNVTVEEVDNAFDHVAARCRFSSPEVRQKFPNLSDDPVHVMLGPLIRRLPSKELKWFLRLVLKNLQPIALDEDFILSQVHFLLPPLLWFQSTFVAADSFLRSSLMSDMPSRPSKERRELLLKNLPKKLLRPIIGVKIGRPTYFKARSLKHCTQVAGNHQWAVQKKYDGEYCQVHVDLTKANEQIQIFAKSGKDATLDRIGVHDWIRRCLRLGTDECKFQKFCILEGELLVYDHRLKQIAQFHKIRKHVTRSGVSIGTANDSPARSHEQLIIIFHDIMLIDDDIIMEYPYKIRKRRLKGLVAYFERQLDAVNLMDSLDLGVLDFAKTSQRQIQRTLQSLFSQTMARKEEGLVLKPYDRPYFSLRSPRQFSGFIKVKKDVIPSLGDTTDLVVVGVARNTNKPCMEHVSWNCYFIACIENKPEVLRFQAKPILKVLDTIYRPCISENDMMYLSNYSSSRLLHLQQLQEYGTYELGMSDLVAKIDRFLNEPLVVEIFGSGFDKPSGKEFYMLRHPRIKKIHLDHGYEAVSSFDELQEMAKESVERPLDLALEEDLWRRRIQDEFRSKRSTFVTNQSPFSGRSATQSSHRSPAKSSQNTHRIVAPTMVRIDSVEFLRHGSGQCLVAEAQPDTVKSTYCRPTSNSAIVIPPDKLSCSERNKIPQPSAYQNVDLDIVAVDSRNVSERAAALTTTENHSNKIHTNKRNLIRETFGRRSPKRCKPLAESSNLSILTHRKDPESIFLAVQDISSEVSFYSAYSRQSDNFSSRPSSTSKEIENGLNGLPKLSAERESLSERTSRSTANAGAGITGFPVESCGDKGTYPAQAIFPILSSSTVYLTPCLHYAPYISENLLPLLAPAHTTTHISHWARDLLDLDPSAAIVSESQAFPGLQKEIFVESRRIPQTRYTIEGARKLKLGGDEEVRVWDWRMMESFQNLGVIFESKVQAKGPTWATRQGPNRICNTEPRTPSISDERKKPIINRLAANYLGKVASSARNGSNDWFPATHAEKLQVAIDLVNQTFG